MLFRSHTHQQAPQGGACATGGNFVYDDQAGHLIGKHITQRLVAVNSVHCKRSMKRPLMEYDGLCMAAELMFRNRSWQLVQHNANMGSVDRMDQNLDN